MFPESGKLATVVPQCSVTPITFNGWGGGYCAWVSVCLCVYSLTYKLTEVTVDQMDPDVDGLIKWSVIRPPTPADISCEG